MPDDQRSIAQRVSALAQALADSDVLRLTIERDDELVEVVRNLVPSAHVSDIPDDLSAMDAPPRNLESIKSDLVGIFHARRPAINEGDLLDGDRDLGYIEALGIRNTVRSRGAGRVVSVMRSDGEAVEYGATIFEIDRG